MYLKQSITPKYALSPALPGLMNDTTTRQFKSETLAACHPTSHLCTLNHQVPPTTSLSNPSTLPNPTAAVCQGQCHLSHIITNDWSANLHSHPIFLSDARGAFGKHKSKHVILPNKHFNGSHCHKVKTTYSI